MILRKYSSNMCDRSQRAEARSATLDAATDAARENRGTGTGSRSPSGNPSSPPPPAAAAVESRGRKKKIYYLESLHSKDG